MSRADDPRPALLVTGGAGYVGSHVVAALSSDHRVVVLDDLSSGHRDAVVNARLVVGRVEDAALVRSLIVEHGVTAVLHFAGRISVAESFADPRGYEAANVDGTAALVRAVRDVGVEHLVFSSSAAVYGAPERVPIPEDHRRAPASPYGVSKARAEDVLLQSGLSVACLRYFNAAGAEPELGLSERHEPETHLIPLALAAAHDGTGLYVFGDDYATPDGTCVRDYIHVADLAAAHLAALRWLVGGGASGVWNVGTGAGYSVLEVLAAVESVTGRPVVRRKAPRRAGDPPVLVADPSRAAADLRWRATPRSDLRGIVADAWQAMAHPSGPSATRPSSQRPDPSKE